MVSREQFSVSAAVEFRLHIVTEIMKEMDVFKLNGDDDDENCICRSCS